MGGGAQAGRRERLVLANPAPNPVTVDVAVLGAAGPVAPAPGEGEVQERVFPRVLQGKDDWLFLGADVSGACEPLLPLDETLAGLTRFGELVQRAGKDYVFTVAPDKSTMNPGKMPESYVGDDCAPLGLLLTEALHKSNATESRKLSSRTNGSAVPADVVLGLVVGSATCTVACRVDRAL